jgi:hypothetical protein
MNEPDGGSIILPRRRLRRRDGFHREIQRRQMIKKLTASGV